MLELVDIFSVEFKAVEIRQLRCSADVAKLLHRQVDLLTLQLAHLADYLRKLCDRPIDVHATEDEYAVGCVARWDDLGHHLTFLHRLDLAVGQLDAILEKGSSVCLRVHESCARRQEEMGCHENFAIHQSASTSFVLGMLAAAFLESRDFSLHPGRPHHNRKRRHLELWRRRRRDCAPRKRIGSSIALSAQQLPCSRGYLFRLESKLSLELFKRR